MWRSVPVGGDRSAGRVLKALPAFNQTSGIGQRRERIDSVSRDSCVVGIVLLLGIVSVADDQRPNTGNPGGGPEEQYGCRK